MKIHLRDMLLLCVIVSMGLAWWQESARHKAEMVRLQHELRAAESKIVSRHNALESANKEADVLAEEVRRLRGVIQSSLDDQRQWFALQVAGKQLVAIQAATSTNNVLTLETLKRIEDATGMEAPRLRHFLTPISDLQIDRAAGGQSLRDR